MHKACPFCGEQIPSFVNLCTHCGNFLDGRKGVTVLPHQENKTASPIKYSANVVAAVLISIVLIAFACFFIGGNKPQTSRPSPTLTVSISTERKITVTVYADTRFGDYPKNPLQFELYKNHEILRTEVENSSQIVFKDVQVKASDILSAKAHWRNGFGAIVRTDKSDECHVGESNDMSIQCKKF